MGVSPLPEALTPSSISWSYVINYLPFKRNFLYPGTGQLFSLPHFVLCCAYNLKQLFFFAFVIYSTNIYHTVTMCWLKGDCMKGGKHSKLKEKKKQVSSHTFLVYSLEHLGSDCNQVITQEHHTATLILQRTRQLWLTFFD